MADCTIYRVRTSWVVGVDWADYNVDLRAVKGWQPRCPACGPLTNQSPAWRPNGPRTVAYKSRKMAKDALYRHRRDAGH